LPNSVHDPIYRELIARVAGARIDARLAQQVVAERLGRPQSYVAKVEGCERRIDVIELLQLAKAIGVDPIPLIRTAWAAIHDGSKE
jgi:transcriptional regulator with XRE-family HTH domain